MARTAIRSQDWLPSSWLYAIFGLKQFWARLNGGDRLVAILAAVFLAALPLSLIIKLSNAVAIHSPAWTGFVTGLSVFTIVSLAITGSMVRLRGHKYFSFLPETNARKQNRVLLEGLVSCAISFLICCFITLLLPRSVQTQALVIAVVTTVIGHTLVHLSQSWVRHLPASLINSNALIGTTHRNAFAPFLAITAMQRLPHSSSRFMRKANSNPLIWAVIIVALLAFGGAAVSLQSPLLGLSSLSSVLMIIQLALIEPRVGNGPAIGAHSKTLPIRRAFDDLMALSLPHFVCFLIAIPLLLIEKNTNHAMIAVGQLLVTIWIIGLFLLVGALPSDKPPNVWLVAIALVSSQMLPLLIPLLLVIVTIMLTRDLMRMSQQGPALWPR